MKKTQKKTLILITAILVIYCFTLTACKKENKEEENYVGNTPNIAQSETDYSDAGTTQPVTQVGNTGEAQQEINYIDQNAGEDGQPISSDGSSTTPADTEGYSPIEVYSATDLAEGTYAIMHTNEDGSVVYYPVYAPYGSYYMVEMTQGAASVQPNRFMWTNIGYDDTAIPTMHQGDMLVFKSADAIPPYFNFERYSDEEYTIGVAGLIQAPSGNYLYDLEQSYVNDIADTIGLKTLGAAQVYIVSAGNVRVSPTTVTATGTIRGLKRGENYLCDVRTGTESITAAFRADSHLFVSLEQYKLANFYFSAKHTIEIAIEPTTPTGYYCINNAGLFRYIAPKDEGKELKAADYNVPFITINTEGKLVATVDGYAIDEEGFVVKER